MMTTTLQDFVKPSVLAFGSRHNPTGFGERQMNKEFRDNDERCANSNAARRMAQQPTIEEGIAEWEAEKAEATPEVKQLSDWSYEDYLDYCADEGMLMKFNACLVKEDERDEELDAIFAAERDAGIKEAMQWNGVEFEHHSPFTKIRTWRSKKGAKNVQGYTREFSSVRLTERQFTADCGAQVPAGYDPYEG